MKLNSGATRSAKLLLQQRANTVLEATNEQFGEFRVGYPWSETRWNPAELAESAPKIQSAPEMNPAPLTWYETFDDIWYETFRRNGRSRKRPQKTHCSTREWNSGFDQDSIYEEFKDIKHMSSTHLVLALCLCLSCSYFDIDKRFHGVRWTGSRVQGAWCRLKQTAVSSASIVYELWDLSRPQGIWQLFSICGLCWDVHSAWSTRPGETQRDVQFQVRTAPGIEIYPEFNLNMLLLRADWSKKCDIVISDGLKKWEPVYVRACRESHKVQEIKNIKGQDCWSIEAPLLVATRILLKITFERKFCPIPHIPPNIHPKLDRSCQKNSRKLDGKRSATAFLSKRSRAAVAVRELFSECWRFVHDLFEMLKMMQDAGSSDG